MGGWGLLGQCFTDTALSWNTGIFPVNESREREKRKISVLQTLRSTKLCVPNSQRKQVSHFKELGKLSSVNAKKLGPQVEREGHVLFFSKEYSGFFFFFQSS